MTDKSIVTYQQRPIIATMDDAERAAKAMSASGFFADTKQASQAIVKILAGQELGFGPFASMTGVAIIQGKPTVGANLMAAAVKRTGKYNYRVIEMTNENCVLAFLENGQEVGRSEFSIDDAKAAGLTSKDNWRKYPRNMLFARALSNGVRWYAPDIFGGATVYTPDEMGAVTNEDCEVVEIVAQEIVDEPDHRNEHADEQALRYEDGSTVQVGASPTAKAEQENYVAYMKAHDGKAPKNIYNLRNWVKSQKEQQQ